MACETDRNLYECSLIKELKECKKELEKINKEEPRNCRSNVLYKLLGYNKKDWEYFSLEMLLERMIQDKDAISLLNKWAKLYDERIKLENRIVKIKEELGILYI
jgi:hypothetical protein